MKKNHISFSLLIFIILIFCTACDCFTTSVRDARIPRDKFLALSGVVATQIDNDSYESVIEHQRFKVYLAESGYTFYIYDNVTLHDPVWREEHEYAAGADGNFLSDTTITRGLVVYRYAHGNFDHAVENACNTYYYDGEVGSFQPGHGDFKVDSTNLNYWYLYYEDSWWRWDVSSLGVNLNANIETSNYGINLEF